MVLSDIVDVAQEGVVRLCGRDVDIVMFREISMKCQEQNIRQTNEYAALNLEVFKWCTPIDKLYFGIHTDHDTSLQLPEQNHADINHNRYILNNHIWDFREWHI